MTIRVLVPPGDQHLRSLAEHMRRLQDAGNAVVLITANRPRGDVVERLEAAGADLDAVHFIDAISCVNGYQPADRPANTVFLQSPTMLEMIAMRTEQVVARLDRPAYVILDSLNALALYNGIGPVQEFSHYLANRLRSRGVSADFVALDNEQGAALEESIHGFIDGRAALEIA